MCDVWRQTVEKCVRTTHKLLLPSYIYHSMVQVPNALFYDRTTATTILQQYRYTTTGYHYNRTIGQFSHCLVFTTFTTVFTTMILYVVLRWWRRRRRRWWRRQTRKHTFVARGADRGGENRRRRIKRSFKIWNILFTSANET